MCVGLCGLSLAAQQVSGLFVACGALSISTDSIDWVVGGGVEGVGALVVHDGEKLRFW